jgi:hypothetical protein
MRRLLVLLAVVLAVQAAAENGSADARVRALAGQHVPQTLVYDRYAGGRPRLVIAAIDEGHFDVPGGLLLIRLPDAPGGSGRIVDRLQLEAGAMELSLIPVVDRKDISVLLHVKHGESGVLVRVDGGRRLIIIANLLVSEGNMADFDGDGIPELIGGYQSGAGTCDGPRGEPVIYRWNGTHYQQDGRSYAAMMHGVAGQPPQSDGFGPPSGPQNATYHLRLVQHYGTQSVKVFVDNEPVAAGQHFPLEDDCHTMTIDVRGERGAQAWAFIERDRP